MNVHAPERQIGESQEDYRHRRKLSQMIVRKVIKGPFPWNRDPNGSQRRSEIAACGGIRQHKRMRSASKRAARYAAGGKP